MDAWFDAFLPTFGLIGLGIFLRARLLRDDALWAGVETLVFWVLLPSLLAWSISTVRLGDLPLGRLAATIWPTLGLATAAAIAIARAFGHGRAAMTSIVQGGIRFNNYTALAIAGGLHGPRGLALAGVVSGLIVPCVQTILTLVFLISEDKPVSPLRMLGRVLANPLLLGCLVGFAFGAAGGMPAGIQPFVRSLGQAALALGLLSVGAGLTVAALREVPRTQAVLAAQKLVAVPLVTLALGTAFGLDPFVLTIAVLAMAMPTAATSYVMARAMGGDARLMAAIITLQHVAAAFTLPVWAALLR